MAIVIIFLPGEPGRQTLNNPGPVRRGQTISYQGNRSAKGLPIYVIGDSSAKHFSDGIIDASPELGLPLRTLGSDGCPLIDGYLKSMSNHSLDVECRPDYEALLKWLSEQDPGLFLPRSGRE